MPASGAARCQPQEQDNFRCQPQEQDNLRCRQGQPQKKSSLVCQSQQMASLSYQLREQTGGITRSKWVSQVSASRAGIWHSHTHGSTKCQPPKYHSPSVRRGPVSNVSLRVRPVPVSVADLGNSPAPMCQSQERQNAILCASAPTIIQGSLQRHLGASSSANPYRWQAPRLECARRLILFPSIVYPLLPSAR